MNELTNWELEVYEQEYDGNMALFISNLEKYDKITGDC